MTAGDPTLRVLLIEDNPGDARLMREAMSGADAAFVHLACSQRLSAGIEHLGREPFDAVLLDLSLPDSQGLESVTRLRAASPRMPVVVMTSLDDEATALRAVSAGAQDYLVKGKDSDTRIVLRALKHAIERQHHQEQLAEARRFDGLGRLAGAMAHEYNTLISTILACTDVAADAATPPADVPDLLRTIERAARRAAHITDEVLATGGRKRLRASAIGLNDAVRTADAALREAIGTRARLRVQLDAEFDAVLFNALEFEHMLIVMIMNALECPDEDAAFEIHTSNELRDEPSARRAGLPAGLYVVLTLRYSGVCDEVGRNALEPFAKPRNGDLHTSGLSLAGVHGTLRACGAELSVESDRNRGTTFTIRFPHRSTGQSPGRHS